MSVRIKYVGDGVFSDSRTRDNIPAVGEYVQLTNGVYRVEFVQHVEDVQNYHVQITLKPSKAQKVPKEDNYGNW